MEEQGKEPVNIILYHHNSPSLPFSNSLQFQLIPSCQFHGSHAVATDLYPPDALTPLNVMIKMSPDTDKCFLKE